MSITIQLEKPIVTHDGPVSSVTLRAPGFAELMKFGAPASIGHTPDGIQFNVHNFEIIKGYIEATVQQPVDGLLLRQLGLVDSLKLHDAVLGFFIEARSRITSQEASTRSKTSDEPSIS